MFARLAPTLRDNGWDPLPIRPASKIPAVAEWQRPASDSRLARWCGDYPDHSVGILCGVVIGIDIDILNEVEAARVEALAVDALGPTPLVRVGQPPKRLLVYRCPERPASSSFKLPVGGVDILAAGRQFVAYGIHPGTGQPYIWRDGGDPFVTPLDALPQLSPPHLKAFREQLLGADVCPSRSAGSKSGAREAVVKPSRPRDPPSGRIVPVHDEATGLIIDGRDKHLANLVYAAWLADKDADPETLGQAAWTGFEATADLNRLKHNGAGPGHWSITDALRKAGSLVKKANSGGVGVGTRLRPHQLGQDVADDLLAAFRALCRNELHTKSGNALRVSDFMCDRLTGGTCVDSVTYIAAALDLSGRTVERARELLLRKRFWSSGRKLGTRDQTAPYRPNPRILSQLAKIIEQSHLVVTAHDRLLSSNHRYKEGGEGGTMPLALPSTSPIILPPQPRDARQGILFAPLMNDDAVRLAAESWQAGEMPEIIRVALRQAIRRRNVRQDDVAGFIGVSRPQFTNALQARKRRQRGNPNAFDLSPAVVERLKAWLLTPDEELTPSPAADESRPARPHHRRGGKRPPDPGPMLPALRLFGLIRGGSSDADRQPQIWSALGKVAV